MTLFRGGRVSHAEMMYDRSEAAQFLEIALATSMLLNVGTFLAVWANFMGPPVWSSETCLRNCVAAIVRFWWWESLPAELDSKLIPGDVALILGLLNWC